MPTIVTPYDPYAAKPNDCAGHRTSVRNGGGKLAALALLVSACGYSSHEAVRELAWATALPGSHICGRTGLPTEVRDKRTGIELVLIPAGTYIRGATDDDPDGVHDPEDVSAEIPARRIIITRPFYLGKYEVTQGQWRRVMGQDAPAEHVGDDLPVVNVSWTGIKGFLERTSFRLPTEAEWEYACRAGTSGPRYGALDAIAWHGDNSGDVPHRVGQKQPNDLGLHDMLGNAAEWCSDHVGHYARGENALKDPTGPSRGPGRVVRGGSFWASESECRASSRWWGSSNLTRDDWGFRVARDP